ncbi:MAG: ABC transporter ATP-binding protein [Eubacteriales bacterium]|nr:ABC transporter ATP-binding protein [Eubacteriales bacterium]
MKDNHLIELRDISKDYNGDVALEHINLYIKDGEFVTLLGPSGCGKTTMLRIIAGFIMPSSGVIEMDGKDIAKMPPYKREVNTVFQKYALFPHLNVFDNIAFGLKIKKTPKEQITEKVNKMLELVNLEGYGMRWIDQLSGGQQQRVAIARALVNEPKILLLDEPLGALDLKLRQEMQVELKRMQQQLGITFIYVTHDQEEALTMSDTIVVMKDGVIQQIGKPTDIYNEPKNTFVADFIGESNIISGIMLDDYKVRMNGVMYRCVDAGFGKNVEVDVVVRPEDIDIIEPEKARISGTVASVVFMGVHYEVCVDCGGYEWIVHTTDFVQQGQRVGISIPKDAIHIMKKTRQTNIFDCEVYPDDNEVYIDNVCFDCVFIEGFENKENALVQIKPSDVELVAPQDAKLTGTVKGCMFLGTRYEITISCEENDWIAYSPDFMEDGEEVGILVPADKLELSHSEDEED